MLNETDKTELFHIYYKRWITVYKEGAIRKVTMAKYLMTHQWLEKLVSDRCLCDIPRLAYQQLLNDYATEHERQTTIDFHHQLKPLYFLHSFLHSSYLFYLPIKIRDDFLMFVKFFIFTNRFLLGSILRNTPVPF